MYDVKTETTIKGTVEEVQTVENVAATMCPGCHAVGGTHLVVKTGEEALEVHVGLTAYLAEKAITFAKGDPLEILGSRVTIGGKPALIAKQIKKGDQTWTLRDAFGRPAWCGHCR
jgi:hypothetical protein